MEITFDFNIQPSAICTIREAKLYVNKQGKLILEWITITEIQTPTINEHK